MAYACHACKAACSMGCKTSVRSAAVSSTCPLRQWFSVTAKRLGGTTSPGTLKPSMTVSTRFFSACMMPHQSACSETSRPVVPCIGSLLLQQTPQRQHNSLGEMLLQQPVTSWQQANAHQQQQQQRRRRRLLTQHPSQQQSTSDPQQMEQVAGLMAHTMPRSRQYIPPTAVKLPNASEAEAAMCSARQQVTAAATMKPWPAHSAASAQAVVAAATAAVEDDDEDKEGEGEDKAGKATSATLDMYNSRRRRSARIGPQQGTHLKPSNPTRWEGDSSSMTSNLRTPSADSSRGVWQTAIAVVERSASCSTNQTQSAIHKPQAAHFSTTAGSSVALHHLQASDLLLQLLASNLLRQQPGSSGASTPDCSTTAGLPGLAQILDTAACRQQTSTPHDLQRTSSASYDTGSTMQQVEHSSSSSSRSRRSRTTSVSSPSLSSQSEIKEAPSHSDAESLNLLQQRLADRGIHLLKPSFGAHRSVCPRCQGGSQRERSLSLTLRPSGFAMWNCFRATCGWSGCCKASRAAPHQDAHGGCSAEAASHQDTPDHASITNTGTNGSSGSLLGMGSSGGSGSSGRGSSGGIGSSLGIGSNHRSHSTMPQVVPPSNEVAIRAASLQPLSPAYISWFERERGISGAVLARNRVSLSCSSNHRQPDIAFPFFAQQQLVNIKYRTLDKRFFQVKGGQQVLYGVDDLQGASEAIIVEGEMDKLAIETATGITAVVSLPAGAVPPPKAGAPKDHAQASKKLACIDMAAPQLSRLQRCIIAVDADEPGWCTAVALQDKLRRVHTHQQASSQQQHTPLQLWYLPWPAARVGGQAALQHVAQHAAAKGIAVDVAATARCKDANDVLRACGPQFLHLYLQCAPVPFDMPTNHAC